MHYPSGIAPAPISTEAKARRRLGKRPRMRCHLYDAAVWVTAGAVSQRRRSRRLVFVLLRAAGALHDTIGWSAESQVPKQLRLNAPLVTADLPRRQWGHSGSPFAAVVDYRCSGAVQQSRPLRAVVAQFPDLGAWPPPNSLRNQKWLPVRLFCRQWRGRDLWRFPPRHLQVAPDRRLGLQAQPRGGGAVRP